MDLTGGLAERWNLKDLAQSSGQQDRPGDSEPRTCRHLLGLKQRCLISCSVFSPRAGETLAVAGVARALTSLRALHCGPDRTKWNEDICPSMLLSRV